MDGRRREPCCNESIKVHKARPSEPGVLGVAERQDPEHLAGRSEHLGMNQVLLGRYATDRSEEGGGPELAIVTHRRSQCITGVSYFTLNA